MPAPMFVMSAGNHYEDVAYRLIFRHFNHPWIYRYTPRKLSGQKKHAAGRQVPC